MLHKTILSVFTVPIGTAVTIFFWYLVLHGLDIIFKQQAIPTLTQGNTIRTMSATASSNANGTVPSLPNATIVPRRSNERGYADHGWLNSYHTFSFASYHDPRHSSFGSLRVLNEDRVAPKQGFPTHHHADFEIFSYILNGELTHRDSIKGKGGDSGNKNDFFVMKRGDIQFTTGGTGIAHSEQNEHPSTQVHFLQIWVKPWSRGLPPNYHTSTFTDDDKRKGFVTLISPLKAGKGASAEAEKAAEPSLEGTIPIHADLLMGAGIVPTGSRFAWTVGGGVVQKAKGRRVYVHLPMTKGGKAKVALYGKQSFQLNEGDGAYVSELNAGDELVVESVGSEEAEVVLLDSD